MSRNWWPCRVCGTEHTNPMSSSICQRCGEKERAARVSAEEAARIERESTPLWQFMAMPESDRWEWIFERLCNLGADA